MEIDTILDLVPHGIFFPLINSRGPVVPSGSSVHGISQASRLSFPSPGDLPNPGIKPVALALQMDSLPLESPGKQFCSYMY